MKDELPPPQTTEQARIREKLDHLSPESRIRVLEMLAKNADKHNAMAKLKQEQGLHVSNPQMKGYLGTYDPPPPYRVLKP